MAQILRPLFHRHLLYFLTLKPPTAIATNQRRHAHIQPRAFRPPRELDLYKDGRNKIIVSDPSDDKITDDNLKKRRSRNEMKRDARQSVRWGMDLASFTSPQIKRILKAASLEQDVFEALMVVKRMGSDVREGKRRQFNYIGKLLRDADAQPDLLGALIQATKDGDQSRFQALAGPEKVVDEGPEEFHESESEEEHEDSGDHVMLANKWIDALIGKDIQTSNEIYSLDSVDFDRQELRKLVRKVHILQECYNSTEDDQENIAKLMAAKKSLNRFLCLLAKRHLISAQNAV